MGKRGAASWTRPFGREGSKGSKGSKRFKGLWWAPAAPVLKNLYNRASPVGKHTTALRAGKSSPLWWLAPPPLPRCEACYWIFGSLCSPTNPVPLPPRYSVGRQKKSAFMGRLGALLRPTCTSYAGCAQWDYGCSAMCHMTPQESVEQTSPSGERGVFPTSAARLYSFRCLWQRCRRRRHMYLSPEGRYLPL